MQKVDLFSIIVESDHAHIEIKSTDSLEVKYFGNLFVEKFGNKWDKQNRLWISEYSLRFTLYDIEIIGSDLSHLTSDQIYFRDFEWWLFRLAIERGWRPFSNIGTFTRLTEFDASL